MYDFSLDRYKVFSVVSETGSFTAASKLLHISQSAVSQSILRLEKDLNLKLFNREPRGIKLTETGHELYSYIRRAMIIIESGENRMDEIKGQGSTTISIGTGDALCRHILLPSLTKFSKLYPQIKVKITNSTSKNSVNLLIEGKVDFALAHNNGDHQSNLEYDNTVELNLIAVAIKGYKLPAKPFTLGDFTKVPLILLDNTTTTRRLIDDHFEANEVSVSPEFTTASTDSMLDLARAGLGVAIVTEKFIDSMKGIEKIEGDYNFPNRYATLISREDTSLSKAAKNLYDTILGDNKD